MDEKETIDNVVFNLTRAAKASYELDSLIDELKKKVNDIYINNDEDCYLSCCFKSLCKYQKSTLWVGRALVAILAAQKARSEKEAAE